MVAGHDIRLFLAFKLPEKTKKDVTGIQELLSKKNPGIRWSDPDSFHLTFFFFTGLHDYDVESASLAVKKFTGMYGPIEFEYLAINGFPNLDNPLIIFLGVEQSNGDYVYDLRKKMEKSFRGLGLDIDSAPWRPHITLGRVKKLTNFFELVDLEQKKFEVEKIELIESRNFEGKRKHYIINSFDL